MTPCLYIPVQSCFQLRLGSGRLGSRYVAPATTRPGHPRCLKHRHLRKTIRAPAVASFRPDLVLQRTILHLPFWRRQVFIEGKCFDPCSLYHRSRLHILVSQRGPRATLQLANSSICPATKGGAGNWLGVWPGVQPTKDAAPVTIHY